METKTKTKTKTSKPASKSPIRDGANVFVRTVTNFYTGRIVGANATEILIDDAAWIADTGRFSTALAMGALNEVEPYPDGAVVAIGRGAIVDVCAWRHALPRTVK